MMNNNTADIIIIGGGLLGASAAYHLSCRGRQKILLFERTDIASQASSRAASLLTRVRTKKILMDMVQETYDTIARIEDDLGENLGMQQSGSLTIASSSAAEGSIVELETIARNYGVPAEIIDSRTTRQYLPWIEETAIRKALYMPTDAFIDSAQLCNGYIKAARKQGVIVRTRTGVSEILSRRGQTYGVQLDSGEKVYAPVVVDAAGSWSNLLSWPLGIGLPMTPVRSHFWITERNPLLFPPAQPFAILPDARAFTRPDVGGLIIGLREPECVAYDPKIFTNNIEHMEFTPDGGWSILAGCGTDFERYFPALRFTGIAHYVAGPSCYVPDAMFVIGPVEQSEGFYALTGCCGAGVAAGGGMGRLVAEQILGEDTFVDATPFSPSRFGAIDPFDAGFRKSCAEARSNKKSG